MMSIVDQVLITIAYGTVIIAIGVFYYMFEDLTDRFVLRIDQLTQQNKELTDRLAEMTLANDETSDVKQLHKDAEITTSLFKENAELATRCALLIQELESLKVHQRPVLQRTSSVRSGNDEVLSHRLTRSISYAHPEQQYEDSENEE
jgi:O-methyltransferase involved in polyketide biosynthesis